MAGNRPIPGSSAQGPLSGGLAASLSTSFLSKSPLAQELVARDLEECTNDEEDFDPESAVAYSDSEEDGDTPALYRGPKGIAFGGVRPAYGSQGRNEPVLTPLERHRSRDAERSLLRDNHFLPPKHPTPVRQGALGSLYKRFFSTKVPLSGDEETVRRPSETSPLLAGEGHGGGATHEHLNEQWEAAVAAGHIKTTWQREAKTIAVYSRSLTVTFLLQYSISVASIFAVGRIGKLELGAISLATMTANITCYAPIQGLATSLDTLCSQAYGSGHKHLVGLQLQRMTYFLLLLLIPLAAVWLNAEPILAALIPERRSAELAALYLRVVVLGTPAIVLFECGKRFVQAQGIFHATTYVLLIAAPLNMFLNWLFVWHLGWGYVGAPAAVAITQNLIPMLLFMYVWKVEGSQCWGGFTKRALSNWGPMIRLALPGMIMVVAEWFAFEILTLAAGQLGTSYLAAQSVLVTVTSTTFQLPFPLSIAGSTRLANLIGAKLPGAAKTAAKVTTVAGLLVGLFNVTLLFTLRYQIPLLLTQDAEVIELVAQVMPICAIMQLFDGLASMSHGILRGIGRQEFGGYANLAAYYLIALPISYGLGFGLDWRLSGLWIGVTIGLFVVSTVEYWFICVSDWERAVKDAEHRNATG